MNHYPRVVKVDSEAEIKKELSRIKVDAPGIEIMSRKGIFRAIKVEALDIKAALILKQEMLARGGEAAISRGTFTLKEKKTDLLLLGTLTQLENLCEKLSGQYFNLPTLALEIKNALKNFANFPSPLKGKGFKFDFSKKTYIMGILNVTPDSFSDGGKFFSKNLAIEHGLEMAEEGADIIDVGGESTRPGSEPISLDEELNRVIPVIEGIRKSKKIPISIDTYKPEVAKAALEAGASMINDIYGLRFPRMLELVAEEGVPIVIMHMKGTPKDMQQNPVYEDVISEIYRFLSDQVKKATDGGVRKESIIIDPGIGFGKTKEHNLELIRRLSEFKSLGQPILVGPSRKSFIGFTLNLPVEERLEGTIAVSTLAIWEGANILRLHDVKEGVRAARMADAILRSR